MGALRQRRDGGEEQQRQHPRLDAHRAGRLAAPALAPPAPGAPDPSANRTRFDPILQSV